MMTTEALSRGTAAAGRSWVDRVRPIGRFLLARTRLAAGGWPLWSQAAGGAATLAGIYLLGGLAVTLIVGGIIATAVGALREAGQV